MDAFLDPQVDCVFCTRGGYGAVRLLPYLDLDAMASSGKMFCGFSDITTLHIALNRRGLVTMHAPMLLSFSVDREDWVYKSFETLLTSTEPIGDSGKVGNTLVGGTAQGRVTGGCLCLLTDSLGTPESIDFEAKLVLIEDVDEDAHRIDAMLQHLVRSGQAESAAGFIVGEMTGTNDRCDPSIGACDWQEIAADILRPLGKPTIMNYPFGHQKGMLSLPLGIEAKLDADAGSLTFLEAACQ